MLNPISWRARVAAMMAAMLSAALPALAAPTGEVVYTNTLLSNSTAWLVNWLPGGTRAQVVANGGVRGANVTTSGTQTIATLDAPYSFETTAGEPDCTGDFPLQRWDTLQVAIKTTSGSDVRGTSSLVELGTVTTLTGCDAGAVVPFGALTDPGTSMRQLPMSARPSLADLTPGVALAGPSEEPRPTDGLFATADVLTFQAGGLARFGATGSVVGATVTPSGWLVLGLPGFERGYTRISADRRTGAEVWLDADWAAGAPTSVRSVLMVKPAAGAGFGTVRQASRAWESGLFVGSRNPFFINLYRDLTGERISINLDTGTETRTPITWGFTGANIVQRRNAGSSVRERTWAPLANNGRARFVMEGEVQINADGSRFNVINPRVNFYNDTGPATPPPAP